MGIFGKLFGKRSRELIPEVKRKKIFSDFMESHDRKFLLGTNITQEINVLSRAGAIGQTLKRNAAQADKATYSKISAKYEISEDQLRAIVEEGEEKKWPFQTVTSKEEPKKTQQQSAVAQNLQAYEIAKTGDWERAIHEWKKALNMSPDRETAYLIHYNIAHALMKMGKYAKSLSVCREVRILANSNQRKLVDMMTHHVETLMQQQSK